MHQIETSLDDIVDEDGDLICPIVYWRGRLSAFMRPLSAHYPHHFGGDLPACSGVSDGATVHALLNIDAGHCPTLEGLSVSRVPLIYPFQHDGGRIEYQWNDSEITVDLLAPPKADPRWPYDGYPRILPETTLGSSAAFDIDEDGLGDLCPQGLPEVDSDAVIVLVPPSEDYGVSLWGEMGDAERVHCMFIYDAATGRICAENQCS